MTYSTPRLRDFKEALTAHSWIGDVPEEVNPVVSLAVLGGVTAAVVALDVYLFRRGYGIID